MSDRGPLVALAALAALAGCEREPLRPSARAPHAARPALSTGSAVPFTQVSAGDYHTCAVGSSGAVTCWGDNSSGQLNGIALSSPGPTTRQGPFTQVATGWGHTCALATTGDVVCWGDNRAGQVSGTPTLAPPYATTATRQGPFTRISIGPDGQTTCALQSDGDATCWGDDSYGQVTGSPTTTAPYAATFTHHGPFTDVSTSSWTCALRTEGSPVCWGLFATSNPAPQGPFTRVDARGDHGCGLRPDGTVACWADPSSTQDYGQANPPSGTFTQVSVGSLHTCGVRTDGDVTCWGYDISGQVSGAPATAPPYGATFTHQGPFTQASAATSHSCALRSDGYVDCWGLGATQPSLVPIDLSLYFTSLLPSPAVLGGSYVVSAAGGVSDEPVVLSSLTPAVCRLSGATLTFLAVGTCTVAADQSPGTEYVRVTQATQSFAVVYAFAGFFQPVDNPGPNEDVVNQAKAGSGIPVKFGLGGDQGLAILRAGYPKFTYAPCSTGGTDAPIELTTTSPGGLTYDAGAGQYTYVWKTDRGWAGTCGRFELGLADGSDHHALVRFVR